MKIDLGLKNIISAWLFINATSGIETLSTEKSTENRVFYYSFFMGKGCRTGCSNMQSYWR